MTYNEVNRILTLEFDVLWEDLWMDQNTKQFKNEYVKSKEKFNIYNLHKVHLKRCYFTFYYILLRSEISKNKSIIKIILFLFHLICSYCI